MEFATLPNLWSLQPSPAQRTFLHRVQAALEIKDASFLAMIQKRVKPPLRGVCGHQPCPLKRAAEFLPALPLAETSFAPKGRHLFTWVCSYQVPCMCTCTCNYPTNHTPLFLYPCARRSFTPQPDWASALLPDHSQSHPCQIVLWVGEMNLEFNSSRTLRLFLY